MDQDLSQKSEWHQDVEEIWDQYSKELANGMASQEMNTQRIEVLTDTLRIAAHRAIENLTPTTPFRLLKYMDEPIEP